MSDTSNFLVHFPGEMVFTIPSLSSGNALDVMNFIALLILLKRYDNIGVRVELLLLRALSLLLAVMYGFKLNNGRSGVSRPLIV